jgi:hypothetical protein
MAVPEQVYAAAGEAGVPRKASTIGVAAEAGNVFMPLLLVENRFFHQLGN